MVLAFSLGGDLLEFRTLVALSKRSRGVQTQNEPKPRTGLPACCGCCRLPACLPGLCAICCRRDSPTRRPSSTSCVRFSLPALIERAIQLLHYARGTGIREDLLLGVYSCTAGSATTVLVLSVVTQRSTLCIEGAHTCWPGSPAHHQAGCRRRDWLHPGGARLRGISGSCTRVPRGRCDTPFEAPCRCSSRSFHCWCSYRSCRRSRRRWTTPERRTAGLQHGHFAIGGATRTASKCLQMPRRSRRRMPRRARGCCCPLLRAIDCCECLGGGAWRRKELGTVGRLIGCRR